MLHWSKLLSSTLVKTPSRITTEDVEGAQSIGPCSQSRSQRIACLGPDYVPWVQYGPSMGLYFWWRKLKDLKDLDVWTLRNWGWSCWIWPSLGGSKVQATGVSAAMSMHKMWIRLLSPKDWGCLLLPPSLPASNLWTATRLGQSLKCVAVWEMADVASTAPVSSSPAQQVVSVELWKATWLSDQASSRYVICAYMCVCARALFSVLFWIGTTYTDWMLWAVTWWWPWVKMKPSSR